MAAPMFFGDGRALVRLASGEYVVVDSRSIDALPYLLGQPVEPDTLFVFRFLLRPDSVVLDIGANFGLYAAVAGKVVAERGRLYAFEGNPLTFQCLARTLYANRLIGRANIQPVNILVSDRWGTGTLFYADNALGGATMTDIGEAGARHFARLGIAVQSLENEVTTIDAFLPADCAVDLVKIDTEGHEPLIIRGMAATIARSPRLRFIIEFNEGFLEHTVPAAEFLGEIHRLGFRACRIGHRAELTLLSPQDRVEGHCDLLLTRTPDGDIRAVAAARRRIGFRLRQWTTRTAQGLRDAWFRL